MAVYPSISHKQVIHINQYRENMAYSKKEDIELIEEKRRKRKLSSSADIIIVKSENVTNTIFRVNNALAVIKVEDVLVNARNDLKSQSKDFKRTKRTK